MAIGIRFIAESYDINSGKKIKSRVLRADEIKRPTTLKEFGYLHKEQIKLIEDIQNFKLYYETKLINEDTIICPNCGKKAVLRGTRKSNFHAALTDHKINIQRHSCTCGWSVPDTVDSIYGSSLHPDLVEKQLIQGSNNSYRQASRNLNSESANNRSINNDDRIRRNIYDVAKIIEEEKLKGFDQSKESDAAQQLIVVVDGGHLKSTNSNSRSFEAMISTVYGPKNIRRIDKGHNEITKKTSVGSALSDQQKTIKKLTQNACYKEGSNSNVTELTCLTDGASNCWSITNSLADCCKSLTNILDWFHVAKKFTIINNHVDFKFEKKLEKVKWFLWHGKPKDALERLNQLKNNIEDDKLLSELSDLQDYILRNEKYIVNYSKRKLDNLPFTSTYAESSVNAIINARQKDNKKMQWSREGAHSVLQIRTSKFSNTWEQDWSKAQEKIYLKAA